MTRTQPGAKPLKALGKPKDAGREHDTVWMERGEKVTASRHEECEGKGCDGCEDKGFRIRREQMLVI
jgi:hypothetical protein